MQMAKKQFLANFGSKMVKNGNLLSQYIWELKYMTSWMNPVRTGVIFTHSFAEKKWRKKCKWQNKAVFSHFWPRNGKNCHFWSWYMWELKYMTSWMKPVWTGVILTPILTEEKEKYIQIGGKEFLAIFGSKMVKNYHFWSCYIWEFNFMTSWMKPVWTGVILTTILAE